MEKAALLLFVSAIDVKKNDKPIEEMRRKNIIIK